MRATTSINRPTAAVALCLLLLAASSVAGVEPATAHGVHAPGGLDRSVASFVGLGFGHMIAGWDHLLFATGVILLAARARAAAKLLSAFVAGHSLTLIAAVAYGWRVDVAIVDAVIAASLLFIGFAGLRGLGAARWVAGAVFAFGLVHGFGLATRLQQLGLPADGRLERALAFNVGVEAGQLVALVAIVAVGAGVARLLELGSDSRPLGFAGLIASGSVGVALIASGATS